MNEQSDKIVVTYEYGKTKVHIVAPPYDSEQEEKAMTEMHNAGWAIINECVEKGEEV